MQEERKVTAVILLKNNQMINQLSNQFCPFKSVSVEM